MQLRMAWHDVRALRHLALGPHAGSCSSAPEHEPLRSAATQGHLSPPSALGEEAVPSELPGNRYRKLAGRVVVEFHPLLVAAAVVISRFNAVPSAPSAIWRPLLLTLAATAVLLLAARVLTRNRYFAAVLTSALVLFSFRELLPAVILVAALIWAGLMRLIGSRISGRARPSRLEAIARVTAVISAATVLVTAGTVAGAVLVRPESTCAVIPV